MGASCRLEKARKATLASTFPVGAVTPFFTVTVRGQISGYLMQVCTRKAKSYTKRCTGGKSIHGYQVAWSRPRQVCRDQPVSKNAKVDLPATNAGPA